jgi:F-type H+-transporting ATPase subunit b
VTFNVWTFLFEVLNFLVLAFVLHRLLYRPLREAIDERRAETERAKAEAEQAGKEADAARAQLAAKLAEADHDRLELLRKAVEQADAERRKRLADAESAARDVQEQASRDADQLRRDTIAALEGEIGTLAVGLAERILAQAHDASLDARLARHLAETIRTVPGDERDRIRRDAGTDEARVESATALDEPTCDDLTAAIHDLLGRPCAVKFDVKCGLVGGALALVGGHVWDATVAAQLAAARVAVSGSKNVGTDS